MARKWCFLKEDIVASPSLIPVEGRLAAIDRPGLGFDLDTDAVARAARAYVQLSK